jgi:bifunctional non-homologous end joining protein LigD
MPRPPIITQVDGHLLRFTSPDKFLYPAAGFTKAELLDYFHRVAPVLLPHITDRPMTFRRYPDGVDGEGFFAKNAPRGTPDWVRTVVLPTPGSTKGRDRIRHVVVGDLATLMWAGNLAALELHVPQWKVGPRGGVRRPDRIVFDLDPGGPATVVECCEVALRLRAALAGDGLESYAKTSGSKGLQVYVAVPETSDERTSAYARELAGRLADETPDLVVDRMERHLRRGKVFVDWSQNNAAKTTVAPYSPRARQTPTVSTPVTWDEVEECRSPEDLMFLPRDVLARVEEFGDLFAPLLEPARTRPPGRRGPATGTRRARGKRPAEGPEEVRR